MINNVSLLTKPVSMPYTSINVLDFSSTSCKWHNIFSSISITKYLGNSEYLFYFKTSEKDMTTIFIKSGMRFCA